MRFLFLLPAIVLALLVQGAGAVDFGVNTPPRGERPSAEPYSTGWSVYIDNDWFGGADRNYTAGFAVGLSGRRATESALSLDPALQTINGWFGLERLFGAREALRHHNISFGLLMFTPQKLSDTAPIFDDRPYACLLFATNSEQVALARAQTAYQMSFTLGLLGTSLCKSLQTELHDLLGAEEPRGWSHQISDGGEPTFQWSLSRQQLLARSAGNGLRHEVMGMAMGAVGFTTQLAAGLAWRWGRIRSPWWSFLPHHVEYVNLGGPGAKGAGSANGAGELYLSVRAIGRYQFYNAFLQGQFRGSDVEFTHSDLEPLIGEAWVGVTKTLKSGLEVSFSLRSRSREVKGFDGPTPVWGSVTLRRVF
ncbi:MAG: lipid A deacylase LpxR family protein [Gammaproteobacteria bacterium]|nr:MAG: lipid A deacylase LpxR family protein [Gammaproteobacteria bacterium]